MSGKRQRFDGDCCKKAQEARMRKRRVERRAESEGGESAWEGERAGGGRTAHACACARVRVVSSACARASPRSQPGGAAPPCASTTPTPRHTPDEPEQAKCTRRVSASARAPAVRPRLFSTGCAHMCASNAL
eukprot:5963796-Pleurochrysis_carterae.AAC.1